MNIHIHNFCFTKINLGDQDLVLPEVAMFQVTITLLDDNHNEVVTMTEDGYYTLPKALRIAHEYQAELGDTGKVACKQVPGTKIH